MVERLLEGTIRTGAKIGLKKPVKELPKINLRKFCKKMLTSERFGWYNRVPRPEDGGRAERRRTSPEEAESASENR